MEKDQNAFPDFVLDLLAGKACGSITPDQEIHLQNWLSENPQLQVESQELLELLQKEYFLHLRNLVNEPKGWESIQRQIYAVKPIRNLAWKWSKYAAVLLAILGFAWYMNSIRKDSPKEHTAAKAPQVERNNTAILILSDGNRMVLDNPGDTLLKEASGFNIRNIPGELLAYAQTNNVLNEKAFNKLMVPAGARYQVQLSDGTKVWMNSVSQLEYPLAFGKSDRKIKLTGEAFFEVAKDANRPFIIDANGYEIKVLGTSFNVSAYKSDDFMETTLVTGAVEITGKEGEKFNLVPEQMGRINNKDQSVAIEKVDTRYFTSWKDGIMYFDNLPLEELATRLERWYGVKIIFNNEKPKHLHFSGAVENSRNIQFLLNLISQTTHVKFVTNEKTITVE